MELKPHQGDEMFVNIVANITEQDVPELKKVQVIVTQSIYDNLIDDIGNAFLWRTRWAKLSNFFSTMSECILIVATSLCFISTYFEMKKFAFAAGMANILVFSLIRMSRFAKNASSTKTKIINGITKLINIDLTVFDLTEFDEANVTESNKIVPQSSSIT